jgi:hypothetical protein
MGTARAQLTKSPFGLAARHIARKDEHKRMIYYSASI